MKTEIFINKAKNKHGNKYDYSLVEYEKAHKKIKIICELHGIFEQSPTNHLSGNSCPKCKGKNKTNDSFINECRLIHGNKYDYSLVEYETTHKKIKIICELHGIFEQTPRNHLSGNSCPKCKGKNKTINEFVIEANLKHNNKYNYSLVKKSKNVDIICPNHGIFNQRLSHHLSGSGCPKCVGKNKTTEEFIHECELIHNNKYDYYLVDYINEKGKINIKCPTHGIFSQRAGDHIRGKGCPICKESKGEREIRNWLITNNITLKPQHRFSDCKNIRPLPFDFYLPDHNICIEYNGIQHYKSVSVFDGLQGFKKRQINDKIKMEYCKDNNIPLIIIKYDDKINEKLILWIRPFQALN